MLLQFPMFDFEISSVKIPLKGPTKRCWQKVYIGSGSCHPLGRHVTLFTSLGPSTGGESLQLEESHWIQSWSACLRVSGWLTALHFIHTMLLWISMNYEHADDSRWLHVWKVFMSNYSYLLHEHKSFAQTFMGILIYNSYVYDSNYLLYEHHSWVFLEWDNTIGISLHAACPFSLTGRNSIQPRWSWHGSWVLIPGMWLLVSHG